jgi:inosose dehydratase
MVTSSRSQTRREMLSGLSKLAGATLLSRGLLFASGPAAASRYDPKLSIQNYIWMQHLDDEKKTLAEGVDDVLSSFHEAGYHRVELGTGFFAPELRDRTLELLDRYKLAPETFFPNTTMHEASVAEKSVNDALELARLLKPHGTRVIVINPTPKPDKAPKTDDELDIQARYVGQLGDGLHQLGMKLALHHHTPELVDNQREWRHLMNHTNPNRVYCCVDVHWAYRGGQDVMTFLRAAGDRLLVLHLRNSKEGVWMEDFGPGDIDYSQVANYLRAIKFDGYLVVELAYEKGTPITRPLTEDLRLSRLYTEKAFGLSALS